MSESNREIAIYGGGGNCPAFLDAVTQAGANVTLIIDQFSSQTDINGIPVVRLNDELDRNLPIFISAGGISAGIARELTEAGFTDVHDFNDSVRVFPEIIGSFLPHMPWYTHETASLVDEAEIQTLQKLLADDTSRAVLNNICEFRQHLDAEHYQLNDGQLQYFPDDVPLFDSLEELRFVDCGAFDGDTLNTVVNYCRTPGLPLRSVCLFEPDGRNLKGLNRKVASHMASTFDIVVLPCGVWSENAIVTLSDDSSSSTIVDQRAQKSLPDRAPQAANAIAAVKLDQTVKGMRPNYIKMDIEGAELEALKGAADIVRTQKPALAICVYHKADDLWEIPKLIRKIQPDYDFYLRSHSDMGLETVLYAVPR